MHDVLVDTFQKHISLLKQPQEHRTNWLPPFITTYTLPPRINLELRQLRCRITKGTTTYPTTMPLS